MCLRTWRMFSHCITSVKIALHTIIIHHHCFRQDVFFGTIVCKHMFNACDELFTHDLEVRVVSLMAINRFKKCTNIISLHELFLNRKSPPPSSSHTVIITIIVIIIVVVVVINPHCDHHCLLYTTTTITWICTQLYHTARTTVCLATTDTNQ